MTETWSTDTLAGQRLMFGFDGTVCDADLENLIRELRVGGLILFSRNLVDAEQITALCRSAQSAAAQAGLPPLLIAIDQEGGQVARLRRPFTEFPGNPHMTGEADAERFGRITAAELRPLGINMDMAPVLDLAPQEIDSVMAGRSFGADPARVARLGTTVIGSLQRHGLLAVAKHFPGIGRTTLDSHLDLPALDTPLDILETTDLVPFQAAFRAGVSGVMLSHIWYRALDPDWPASLSEPIARRLLREKMGFEGVVMTDDLDMGAIRNHFAIPDVAAQILAADIDIALICHRSPDMEQVYGLFFDALSRSGEMRARGEAAVERIMAVKRRSGD